MKKVIASTLLVLLLMLCTTPAHAGIPTLPHAFYGEVEVNGSLAPDGTQVSAMVDVGDIVPTQNPVGTVGGKYGTGSPYLLVQGNVSSGAVITFYVAGIETDEMAIFEIGGGPTKVDLSVVISKPAPIPGVGNGGLPEPSIRESSDGNVGLSIPYGTVIRDSEGRRIHSRHIKVKADDDPPAVPEDSSIIGLAYNFEPSGTTFDPPITLTWNYPDALSEGVAEEDLALAYYLDGEWVELECVVDIEGNTITASVKHFTTFAIIGKVEPTLAPVLPPTPAPAPPPVPPVIEPVPMPAPIPPAVIPAPEPTPELPEEPAPVPEAVAPTELPEKPNYTMAFILGGFVLVVVFVAWRIWYRARGKRYGENSD